MSQNNKKISYLLFEISNSEIKKLYNNFRFSLFEIVLNVTKRNITNEEESTVTMLKFEVSLIDIQVT